MCSGAPGQYVGESKLLSVALPEELGSAVQLAPKLWLRYIEQTTEMEMDLCGLCSMDGLLVWLVLKVWIMV